MTNVPTCMKRATKHLEPLILERLKKEEEYGTSDWPDKPVSFDIITLISLTGVECVDRMILSPG